ncbi:MAG TPA: hypothetical protein ACFE0H_06640 [Elainellaceae cyanobacterium]
MPTSYPLVSTSHSLLLSHQLWDWAGVDGLQFARAVFGDSVGNIAPFQSIETTYQMYPCSVLRLCEGNFRVAIAPEVSFQDDTQAIHSPLRMWLKPSTLVAIALADEVGMNILPQIATTKSIYRLDLLQANCAAPARINDIAVLIWRHRVAGTPIVELHVALSNLDALQTLLNR